MKLYTVAALFFTQALLTTFTLAAPILNDSITNKRLDSTTHVTSRSIHHDPAVQLDPRAFGSNKAINGLARGGSRKGFNGAGTPINKPVQAQTGTGRAGTTVGTAIGTGRANALQGTRNGGAQLINSGVRGAKSCVPGSRNCFQAIGGGLRGQKQQPTVGQPQPQRQPRPLGQSQNQGPRPSPGLLRNTRVPVRPSIPGAELSVPLNIPAELDGRPIVRPPVFTG